MALYSYSLPSRCPPPHPSSIPHLPPPSLTIQSVMDQYGRQHHHQQHINGPVSPPQQYATSYSSYVESSRSYGDSNRQTRGSNKPPPSPIMQRSIPPAQSAAPPAPIPARGSSREFMQRTRSNSSSSWQQQQQQHRSTLTRQQSDILYDRRDVEHIQPKSYGSTHSTPPLSPRAASPIVSVPCMSRARYIPRAAHLSRYMALLI